MNDGVLLIDRKLGRHPLWLSELPAHEGEAWMDLMILANQQPAEIKTGKGDIVCLERGQVGWSKMGLAKKWGWGQGKVSRYLDKLARWGQITVEATSSTTVITLCNYVDYQSALLKIMLETMPNGETVERPWRDRGETVMTEKGEGRRESLTIQGEGRGDCNTNRASEGEILQHFARMGSDYSAAEIHLAFLAFENSKDDDGQWKRLTRPYGLVTDWRHSVEHQLAFQRCWVGSEKNGAKKPAGSPVWQQVKELKERRDAVRLDHDSRVANGESDYNPEIKALWKEWNRLDEEVKQLEPAV